ncbi:hypothetical protein ABPG74_003856 [Tetrahymena malaccensis]
MANHIQGGDVNIELQNTLNDEKKIDSNNMMANTQRNNVSQIDQDVKLLDKVPADISLAEKHGKAKKVAKPVQDCKEFCQCCGYPIDNQEISMFCDNEELSFLGPGIPLYFGFIKACLVLLTITALIYTIYGMILNHLGSYCFVPRKGFVLPQGACFKNLFNEYSLINRMDDIDTVKHQNWVNLASVVVLVVALHLYRRQVRAIEDYLDFDLISPSDFTVQLSGLPPNFQETDIRKLLNDWWDNQSQQTKDSVGNFVIEKVSIAYDVKDYIQKTNERNKINLQIRKNEYYFKINKKYPPKQPTTEELKAKRREIEEQIFALEKEVFDGNYNKTTPHAFVTFNSRKVMDYVTESQHISYLQRFWLKIKVCFGSEIYEIFNVSRDNKTYIVNVHRAPEPSDINWENCSASSFQQVSRRLLTWIFTFIILCFCFLLIYFINLWQYNVNQDNKRNTDDPYVKAKLILLSLFSSLAIVIINSMLVIILKQLSFIELQPTVTDTNISVSEKLVIGQFCNSALITLVVNFTIDVDSFWGSSGITNDFTLIALSNCVVPPLLTIFNPFYYLRLFKRRQIRNDKNGYYSQGEAHLQFEGSPVEMYIKYAAVIKTLLIIGFYTPLSPYLPMLGMITLFLSYLSDKYVLINRCARPNQLGSDLNKDMLEFAEYFPLSIAIGNLVWMRKLDIKDQQSLILQLVAIGISALNFIIPSSKLNKMIFKIEELDDAQRTGDYQNQQYNFANDYDRCNPITKEKAIKSFFQELKKRDSDKAKQLKQQMIYEHPENKQYLKSVFPFSQVQQPAQNSSNNSGYVQQNPQIYSQHTANIPSQLTGMPQVNQYGGVNQYQQPQYNQIPQVANPMLGGVNQQPFNVVGAVPPYSQVNQSYSPHQAQQQQLQANALTGYQYPTQVPYQNNMFGAQPQYQPGYNHYDNTNMIPHQSRFA